VRTSTVSEGSGEIETPGPTMSTKNAFTLVVERVASPVVVVHGGAGAYLKTTSPEQRCERGRVLQQIATHSFGAFSGGGARKVVLSAVAAMELDERFNAGRGSKLQRDGKGRLSAALMDGATMRLSSVYNVQDCLHPSDLANALQSRPDRNLDGDGAALLMKELEMRPSDVRTPQTIERWEALLEGLDTTDVESAIGDAGRRELAIAKRVGVALPDDLTTASNEENRYGTVGAVALDGDGGLWACTSTGGRGHEHVGRVSDTPTPAGNYACPAVAVSATGFGEQILDLNVCGRIATRMLDGATLKQSLETSFREIAAHGGLLGVIAVSSDGHAGYAYTTEACGVAWYDGQGGRHIDPNGRS
jgi:L-asparaginase